MNTKKIDFLNVWFILISLLIAVIIPFRLFLFSYAFFGPLHYLTEINWLNQKGYFIKSKNKSWKIFFISICSFIVIFNMVSFSFSELENSFLQVLKDPNSLLIVILLFSTALILFKKVVHLIISLVFIIILTMLVKKYSNSMLIYLGLFIPTLIHVYIFTLFFMIYGAIKTKSQLGFFCVILMVFVPVLIAMIDLSSDYYKLSEHIDAILRITSVPEIINLSTHLFSQENLEFRYSDLTIIGVKTQIFIAFAYTYHYLNWFSKTSIIGWKRALTKQKTFFIIMIWVFSVLLYLKDYKTGLSVLFILSYIHVLLEFPLNVVTIREILLLTKHKHNMD
jgi:hypothetical protein